MKKIFKSFSLRFVAIVIFSFGLQCAYSFDLSSINYDYLSKLPFGTGVVEVYKNGSILTPNGSMISYKTNQGRLGVLEMTQTGESLIINWITYNNDKSIASQGMNLQVGKNSFVNLDNGLIYATTSTEIEFRWVFSASATNTTISFFFGTFYVLPSSDCFNNLSTINSISQTKIQSYPLWVQDINATNYVTKTTKIIYQTNEGRNGVLEVVNTADGLIFNWITYNNSGAIYSTGCNQNVPKSFSFDLDKGKMGVSVDDDIFWSIDAKLIKWIRSENNTKLAIMPNDVCESNLNKLKEISFETIKNYPLAEIVIDGSDNNNQLNAGSRIAYKTPEGRFGIFTVFQPGEDMLIDRITYDNNGQVVTWGCFERIEGSYSYSLDHGGAVNIQYSSMHWNLNTKTTRYLVPKNGTKFYVIDQPTSTISEMQNAVGQIYPNPATNNIVIATEIENSIIVIHDQLGKQTIKNIKEDGSVSLEGLSSGLYQISFETKNGWQSQKVIIQ